MAVGELLIVCDMGDKVEMSSGQSEAAELSPRWHQIETLGTKAADDQSVSRRRPPTRASPG